MTCTFLSDGLSGPTFLVKGAWSSKKKGRLLGKGCGLKEQAAWTCLGVAGAGVNSASAAMDGVDAGMDDVWMESGRCWWCRVGADVNGVGLVLMWMVSLLAYGVSAGILYKHQTYGWSNWLRI